MELPHTRSCFVCGSQNPHGLKMRFHLEGEIVTARFRPAQEHIGFQNVVHGGIAATILDEIMVWACAAGTKHFAYCAELNIRYRHALEPGAEYTVQARLLENKRNKFFVAAGEIYSCAGDKMTVGTGKYMPVPNSELQRLLSDWEGNPDWFNNFFP